MNQTQSVSRKGFLLVLIPVIFELVFVTFLTCALLHAENESDRIERAKDTLEAMNSLDASVVSSMMSIVRADRHQDAASIMQLDNEIEKIKQAKQHLSKVDMKQVNTDIEWFDAAKGLCERSIIIVQNAKKSFLDPDTPKSRKLLPVRHDILFTLMEFRPLKEQVIKQSQQVHALGPIQQGRDLTVIYSILAIGLVMNGFISIVLVTFFSRDFEQRLDKISKNASKLAMGRALPSLVAGNDEITALDRVLHNTEAELANARRRELSVLDNATDVIVSLDRTFHITAAGQSAIKIWKYTEEELLGNSVFFLMTETSKETSHDALKTIGSGGKEGHFDCALKLKDGTLKDTSWSASWSPEDQTYYCVIHDITERKALERLKQRFAAIIGDDLNISLKKISHGLATLKSGSFGKLEGKAYDNVFKAEVSINRLIELANDLLDLERIEAGKLTIQPKPLRAARLCNAAIDSVEAFAKSANIEIERPTTDADIHGEERRIVQALINLLSNAIKFSPENSSISITIASVGSDVEISVIDQGPGIPEKDQTMIFERFRQSETQTGKDIKSTGLGLAIVKAIMEAHHGAAGVESSIGNGSRFWLRFPGANGDAKA